MSDVAKDFAYSAIDIRELITPERIELGCEVSSKKRFMEHMAQLLTSGDPEPSAKKVYQILIERERLGSTGVGDGVALPHGRVPDLERALGALMILLDPLDYDSLDRSPIKLAFGLLVPVEATEEHLRILAHLARLFSDAQLRQALLAASRIDEVYQRLVTASLQA